MGLDVSSTSTGVAVVNVRPNGAIEFVATHAITTSSNRSIGERETYYSETLYSYMEKYRPDVIVQEGSFMNKRYNATEMLYMWNGMTYYTAHNYGIDHITKYTPTNIKRVVAGHGQATKQKVAEGLDKYIYLPDIDSMTNDETDAFAVILTHLLTKGGAIPRRELAMLNELDTEGILPTITKL